MASKEVKGLVIQIEGNSNGLVKSLKEVDAQLKKDEDALKRLDKALKLDPKNVDLVAAKEAVLADKTAATSQKMQILQQVQKDALSDLPDDVELSASQMAELQAEISSTESELSSLASEASGAGDDLIEVGDSAEDAGDEVENSSGSFEGFGEKAKQAADIAKGALEGVIKVVATVTTAAAAAGAAIGSAFVGIGKTMVSATMDTSKLADELLTMSSVTGLSTETLQELNYASELLDVNTETITGSMTKMLKQMSSAADGSKGAAEKFKKLGVAITDSSGQLRDTETVYWEAIDRLGKISNETERDALAMEVFGKSARELNPLIEAGSGAFEELAAEAHNVGYVMDEETLAAFGHLDDNMQRLQNGAQSVKQSIGQVLLPSLTSLTDDGVEELQWFARQLVATGGDAEEMAELVAEASVQFTAVLRNNLPQIVDVISGLVQAVLPAITSVLPDLVELISEMVGTLANAIAENADTFIAAFSSLAQALVNGIVTILPTLIPIGISIIQTLVEAIVDNIDLIVDGAVQLITALVNALTQSNILTKLVTAAFTIVTALAMALLDSKNIKSLVESVKQLLLALVKGISTNLPTIIPAVVEAFSTLATALTDPAFLTEMIGALVECLIVLADTIVENLPLFINSLVTIIGNLALTLIENFPLLIETALRLVGELIFMVFETIGTLLGFNLDEIFEIFSGAFDTICEIFEGIGKWFGERWEEIKGVFSKVGEFFSGIFETAWNCIKKPFETTASWFSELWDDIKAPFSKVGEFFEGAFKTVGDVIKAPLNAVIKGINVVIGALNSLSIDIPSWVPGIGGDTWGIDIPKVPLLARGGVLAKGQIGLLEGSGAEAVVPLENNDGWIKATAAALKAQFDYSVATNSNIAQPIDYTSSFQMMADKISGLQQNGEEKAPPTFHLLVQLGQQKFAEMVAQAQADNTYYAGGY